jgi:hypothetical protein
MLLQITDMFRRLGLPRHIEVERRLHNRALLYWQSIRQGSEIPLLKDFDALVAEGSFDHGFLLSLELAPDVMIIEAGDVLRDEAGLAGMPVKLCNVAPSSLVGQFGRRWGQVITERAPVTSEYDFVTDADFHVYCRGALLPLSCDGRTIDRIFGVVTWKSVRNQSVNVPDR